MADLFDIGLPRERVKHAAVDQDEARQVAVRHHVDLGRFSLDEFRQGLEDEREHDDITGGDEGKLVRIVVAHLREHPRYYSVIRQALGRADDDGSPRQGRRMIIRRELIVTSLVPDEETGEDDDHD